MPLTIPEQVRLKIQDPPRVFDETREFDGTATFFALPYSTVTSATAFVPLGGTAWSATGVTFASGYVQFSAVGSAHSAFRVRGVASVFSEAEIGQFTADGGSVLGAAVAAIEALLFDSLKRARWAAPDGTTYDDTAAMSQLNAMYDRLRAQLAEAEVTDSGFASWTEGQADW
jgi:hypothetical protein